MKKLIKKILKEDDWDWVRDINHEIVLEPNTLYYFDPKLTAEETIVFADNIIDDHNHRSFKQWFSNIPNKNSSVVEDGGIKYFMTKPERVIGLQGWCTETDIDYMLGRYPGVNVVNAREYFNL